MFRECDRLDSYLDKVYWNGLLKIGLSRFFILRVLYTAPLHGYAIAKKISDLTTGCCSPTEGSLYPVLNEFLAGGYVTQAEETVQGRCRKVYTLTLKGKEAYKAAMEAWEEATRALVEAREEFLVQEVGSN